MSSRKIKKKGRNYWFPSLDDLVGDLVDRVELLTVFAEFAVVF